MERLTDEQIKNINNSLEDSWNQGIFKEPYGIDVKEKGYVIYQRHKTGGAAGGSYHEDSYARPYVISESKPNWDALDEVLRMVCPEISYLKYKEIEKLIINSNETDYEFYGNYTDYEIFYLPLEKLYLFLSI